MILTFVTKFSLISLIIIIHLCNYTTSQNIEFGQSNKKTEFCTTLEGERGQCTRISHCLSVKNSIAFTAPTHCSFIGKTPIVCCPSSTKTEGSGRIRIGNTVAAPKVKFECGVRNIKYETPFRRKRQIFSSNRPLSETTTEFDPFGPVHAVGAVEAVRNSWPWMVLLWRQRGPDKNFFCGGTLVNPRFVVTAAHCVLSFDTVFARLGEHDHKSGFDDLREDVKVKNFIFHPDYNLDLAYNDIALLELVKDVTLKEEVQPICLPWGGDMGRRLENQKVTIAGWGKDGFGSAGLASPVLLELNLTVFQTEVCRNSYSKLPDYNLRFPNGLTTENTICAGDVEGGKDTCEGDSGGPVMFHSNSANTFSLVGVISTGNGCGRKEFPGLNAPIANVDTLQWIKDIAFLKLLF